jgi:malate permease and related proteins
LYNVSVITASWFAAETPSIKQVLFAVFRFPPFISFLIAIALNSVGYQYPSVIKNMLSMLSSPFTVIALLSVGMQINFKIEKENKEAFFIGMAYKSLIAPLIIYFLCNLLIEKDIEQKQYVFWALPSAL